ncbi:MAG: hypothetical protein Q4G49_03010, partial [Paracoccus sp. (in: a-proteobacteria)]|nr:hypothetical protein [Paracoccus sp. (in: a-proteobacteria)]
MRKYLARNFVAAHITDAAGMAQPVDLRDHQGVSLLSGAGPVPPRIAGSLPDLLLTAGGNEVRIDLTPLFAGASSYSVTPMPAGVTLDDAILAIDPLDEIAPIQIGVRGVNAAGASNPVQFMLTVSMSAPEIVGPTAVTLSSIARTVQADTALPLILAALAADGTAPLTWALTAGAPHAEIDISAQPPRLMLAQMPAVGAQAITVRASNSAGQATASFDLTVEAAVIDPPSEIVVSIAGNPDTVTSGQSLTGTITGAPAGATIQHRWTDGTAPYVGATAATFIPVIGAGGISDLSPVYYEPIIDGAAYRSDRVDVIHAAPIASGSMPDLTMTQGDATATGDASTY